MESGILNRIREHHETIEHAREEAAQQLLVKCKHFRHELIRDHFVRQRLETMQHSANKLCDLYDDADLEAVQDLARSTSTAAASSGGGGGGNPSMSNIVKEFEGRVAALREYHYHNPQPAYTQTYAALSVEDLGVGPLLSKGASNNTHKAMESDGDGLRTESAQLLSNAKFSGPERNGFFLDLQTHYSRYINFLAQSADYKSAKNENISTLHNDKKRSSSTGVSHPTLMISGIAAAGSTGSKAGGATLVQGDILEYYMYVANLGAFTGIPPERKAYKHKLYSEYMSKLLEYLYSFFDRTKPLAFGVSNMIETTKAEFSSLWDSCQVPGWKNEEYLQNDALRKIALDELLVDKFLKLLSDVVSRTAAFAQRKLTKSTEEIEREIEAEDVMLREAFEAAMGRKKDHGVDGEGGDGAKDKDDENKNEGEEGENADADDEVNKAVRRNEKNLPIDPHTGKPIPVYLYYLHQLHKKYSCKICGNFEYAGNYAFVKHFSEPRHTEGLRLLGITENSQHYHLITQPEKAIEMYHMLKNDKRQKRLRPEDEQIEDHSGLVRSRQEEQELRRQVLSRTNRI